MDTVNTESDSGKLADRLQRVESEPPKGIEVWIGPAELNRPSLDAAGYANTLAFPLEFFVGPAILCQRAYNLFKREFQLQNLQLCSILLSIGMYIVGCFFGISTATLLPGVEGCFK